MRAQLAHAVPHIERSRNTVQSPRPRSDCQATDAPISRESKHDDICSTVAISPDSRPYGDFANRRMDYDHANQDQEVAPMIVPVSQSGTLPGMAAGQRSTTTMPETNSSLSASGSRIGCRVACADYTRAMLPSTRRNCRTGERYGQKRCSSFAILGVVKHSDHEKWNQHILRIVILLGWSWIELPSVRPPPKIQPPHSVTSDAWSFRGRL